MTDIPTMISAFSAAAGGIKSAVEVIKSVRGSPSLPPPEKELLLVAEERMIAAHKAHLDFKDRAFALQEENAALKKRVVELEKFHAEKEGLESRVIARGASAFIDKTALPPYEGSVWYCEHCLNKGVKAPFHLEQRDFGRDTYSCAACAAKIKVPNDLRAEVIATGGGGRRDVRGF